MVFRLRYTIQVAFHWRADHDPLLVVFRSSLPSPFQLKKGVSGATVPTPLDPSMTQVQNHGLMLFY